MDPFGKEELIAFYNRHLRDFGDSPLSVRWTPVGQRRRYEILLQIAADISGKDLLDFGCGKGDFYAFLNEQGVECDYTGIDLNENLIRLAERKFPEARFMVMDIEEEDLKEEFDIAFLCGVFNLRIAGIRESMLMVLKRIFNVVREAMHINGLSYYDNSPRDIELYYVRPEDIIGFVVEQLSGHMVYRHGMIKGDYFLSVYKNLDQRQIS